MQRTKPVAELVAGDFIVRVGKQPVGATLVAVKPLEAGTAVSGPQGGQYELRGSSWVALVTGSGNPVVRLSAFATVELAEEW